MGQSARILPIHVEEGDIRGKLTRFYFLVSGRPRSRELRDLVSFQLDKTGPRAPFYQAEKIRDLVIFVTLACHLRE